MLVTVSDMRQKPYRILLRRLVAERPRRPDEADGCDIVRRLLPEASPLRAWSNFEFRDSQGRWDGVDLLGPTRDGL
jgi:hypothetical protein